MKNFNVHFQSNLLGLISLLLMISCQNNNVRLTAEESAAVKESVTQLAANISMDLTSKGPAAWVNYFENDPGFFMASNGMLVFKDYKTAKTFTLDTVAKKFKKINLSWKNLKIDPLTATYASFGADFHEDIVLANGKALAADGYFTATAHFDGTRWKLRNMNWAMKSP
jgi:hypothetical protein